MAVKEKSVLMEQLKTILGDNISDDALSLVEDVSDTIDDLHNKAQGDGEDWEKKYKENDAMWRERYKERFFNGTPDGTGDGKPDKTEPEIDPEPEDETDKPMHFSDLFEISTGKE